MKINYTEIAKFYKNIISEISSTIWNAEQNAPTAEEKKRINQEEYLSSYVSFDKATEGINDIFKLIEFHDEDDFEYYALERLSNARHRIESFLKNSKLEFSESIYSYNKYDSIIIDYFQPKRCSHDEKIIEKHHRIWSKYRHILYRRTSINYGLISQLNHLKKIVKDSEDIDDKESELNLIDEIKLLVMKLNGYKEDY